jgi:hypothetical protein
LQGRSFGTAGQWRRRKKNMRRGGSGLASFLHPFLAGGEDPCHLQPKENAQAVCFSYFSDLFSSAFHPDLLHFLLSQICSLGFAVFPSALGSRW